MQSFSAIGWTVHFVHRHDAEHPDSRRPAHVLVAKEGTEGWLHPLSGDAFRLLGHVLGELEQKHASDEWVKIDPQRWVPGKVPVVGQGEPLQLNFVDPSEVERRRRFTAARSICALLESPTTDWLDKAAQLEHADQLLGGNAVSVAALLTLNQEAGLPTPPELGDVADLRYRLLRAAPSGMAGFLWQLEAPGFEPLRTHRTLRVKLIDSAEDAFNEARSITPGRWSALRSQVLLRWWLRTQTALHNRSVRSLAEKLGAPVQELMEFARGESIPKAQLLECFPPEQELLAELAEDMEGSAAPEAVAAIASVHQPRLELMASQMAELERRLHRQERLLRWERMQQSMRDLATSATMLDALTWRRAEYAARRTREELLDLRADERLEIGRLMQATASHVLAAVMPFEQLLGEWAIGVGGAPVLAINPVFVRRDLGMLRSAIAHQLGHLIESMGQGTVSNCSKLARQDESSVGGDGQESFANAFALYLLAPRPTVLRLIGRPPAEEPPVDWLQGAAQETATVFGISPGAAARHVLNCLKVERSHFQHAMHALWERPSWAASWERIHGDIETDWKGERQFIEAETGELPRQGPAEALRRPSSLVFDKLVADAASTGLLTPSQVRELAEA
jgi:hypothetical protein